MVLSDVLTDFASLVESSSIGKVIPASASALEIAASVVQVLRSTAEEGYDLRRRCREAAEKFLVFNSALDVYREIYAAPRESKATVPLESTDA